MWETFLSIFGWLISLFRPSQDVKLGQLEGRVAGDDKLIQEIGDNDKLREANSTLTDDELRKWVREQNRRRP